MLSICALCWGVVMSELFCCRAVMFVVSWLRALKNLKKCLGLVLMLFARCVAMYSCSAFLMFLLNAFWCVV